MKVVPVPAWMLKLDRYDTLTLPQFLYKKKSLRKKFIIEIFKSFRRANG